MTEQELIQENEKLKGRLAKAIEVFKEQKENITALTEERDKAKADADFQAAKVQKLEEKLAEKSENDDKFFEQEEEIGNLNAKIEQLTADNSNLNDSLNYEIGQKQELQEVVEKQAKNVAERDSTIDELREKVNSLSTKLNQCSNELSTTKKDLEELEIDYNSSVEERENLEKENQEQHETIENLTNALDKVNETLNQERKEHQEFIGRLIDKEDELHTMLTTNAG